MYVYIILYIYIVVSQEHTRIYIHTLSEMSWPILHNIVIGILIIDTRIYYNYIDIKFTNSC